MAQEDTIQDIISRIEQARDRCQNAADHQGVQDADLALGDLRSLQPFALPTARDIEAYFNERVARRETPAPAPPPELEDEAPAIDEPMPAPRVRATRWTTDSSDDS